MTTDYFAFIKRTSSFLILLLFVIILEPQNCKGQEANVDSLEKILKTSKVDSIKLPAAQKLGQHYRMSDPQMAIKYMEVAVKLANKLGKKNREAVLLNSLGGMYYYLGNYKEALSCSIRGEKIMAELGNKDGLADCYNGIGLIYSENGQPEMSLKYFRKSLALRIELKDTKSIAGSYNNIGGYYEDENSFDSCLFYYKESLKYTILSKDSFGQGMGLNNIGLIFAKQSKPAEAESYFFKSLEIKRAMEDQFGEVETLINLGDLYHSIKKYNEAENYLLKALEVSKNINALILIRDCYYSLSVNYKSKKDINKAFEAQTLYTAYKDSLSDEERTRTITEMNAKFDSEKKEQEIKLLNLESEKQAEISEIEHKRKNIIIWSVAAGLFLVLIFSIFIFNRFKITQKQKGIIEKQKVVVEEQRAYAMHQKELVEEKQKEILDSIHYAKRIQRAVITSDNYISKYLKDYFILYKPKDIVAGDFYWALEANNKFYLAISDCTGHGVPGAFMSLLNISILNETMNEKKIYAPNEILNTARKEIIKALNQEGQEESKDGMDCILACFDFESMQLTYAAANNSFYIARNGELIFCPADKMPVGKSPKDEESFTLREVKLEKGDIVYMLTDGYPDQFGGPKGKKFKYKQLEETFLELSLLPSSDQKNLLDKRFEEWKSTLEQVDDVLVAGIKV